MNRVWIALGWNRLHRWADPHTWDGHVARVSNALHWHMIHGYNVLILSRVQVELRDHFTMIAGEIVMNTGVSTCSGYSKLLEIADIATLVCREVLTQKSTVSVSAVNSQFSDTISRSCYNHIDHFLDTSPVHLWNDMNFTVSNHMFFFAWISIVLNVLFFKNHMAQKLFNPNFPQDGPFRI